MQKVLRELILWSKSHLQIVSPFIHVEQLPGRYSMMLFPLKALCRRQGKECGASKQGLTSEDHGFIRASHPGLAAEHGLRAGRCSGRHG